jgi:hypothetical protein
MAAMSSDTDTGHGHRDEVMTRAPGVVRQQLRHLPLDSVGATREEAQPHFRPARLSQLDSQLGQIPDCAFSPSYRTSMDTTPQRSTLLRTHSMGSGSLGLSTLSLVSSSPLLPILLA